MFFKLIKVHLLVSELYIYQNARCNVKKIVTFVPDTTEGVKPQMCV